MIITSTSTRALVHERVRSPERFTLTTRKKQQEEQIRISRELEEISAATREVIKKLQEGQEDAVAYALLYDLRWRLGRVVKELGVELPQYTPRKQAKEMIDAALRNPEQEDHD